MSTVEPVGETAEPARAADAVEAVLVEDVPRQVRLTTPGALPVAAPVAQPSPVRARAVSARLGTDVLGPLREAAGQIVPQLQYQIARLGIAGQAGLVAFVAAAALAIAALLPGQHALQSLHQQIAQAQHPYTAPGIEEAIPRLVSSLPTRGQIPAVISQMYAQAQAAGVSLDKGRYAYAPPKAGAIGRYQVEFPVAAAYPAIRTFIDGTLTAVPAASLDKLRLERKAVGEQVVNADIGFIVFVRGEGAP